MNYIKNYVRKNIVIFIIATIFLGFFCVQNNLFGFNRRIKSDLSTEKFEFAKNIVEKAESYRGYLKKDFMYSIQVKETLNEEERSTTLLDVYVHFEKSPEYKRNVIAKMKTGNSAGNIILQKSVTMWFYKPGTANAFRISPAQRLLGGASYADVASTNYSRFYDPVSLEEVSLGQSLEAYKVGLKKVEHGVAYASIDFYITKNDNKPIKAEFYTQSGKKLKVMYFRNFISMNEKEISSNWVIVNALNPKAITYIDVQGIKLYSLPAPTFSTEGIKNF